ncbi:MAG: SDR family oxidoreductase, partial [Candidatus Saganbacteria bacterium]|nr:SDR family oxidoreductase [Candidatus Saganbacteria bacterium]
MREEDFDSVIKVNLKGTYNLIMAISPLMMKARSGKIVNIASVVGQMGNVGQANYAASKAGIIGLTKTAAKELARRGINVNAVAPGFIDTEMTKRLPEEVRAKLKEAIPLERLGAPEDVASAVLFLASDGSNYITGQVINVNGGMYS